MPRIRLALGYDTERPYGDWADSPEGRAFRERQLAFVQRLADLLDAREAPRTWFLLGDYLERCLNTCSRSDLRALYAADNPLNDLQQHSHSHWTFRLTPDQPYRTPVSVDRFAEDVERAGRAIEEILGVVTVGLRTPVGYPRDLSDLPELVAAVGARGIRYISSWLRSTESWFAELSADRQPRSYAGVGHPAIVEIPASGWLDVVFTPDGARRFLQRSDAPTAAEVAAHWLELLDRAAGLAESGQPVTVALALHPWAVMEYDPRLEAHGRLLEAAEQRGVEIVSYSRLAAEVLGEG